MMDLKTKYRLRVQSCIGTIIDVHKVISEKYENEQLQPRFEDIEKAIEKLDMDLVSEGDMLMMEKATNALLGKFRPIFEAWGVGPVYENARN
ncbi:MAG: hypothetical protein U9N82_02975 [Thermodesulfobacteriota bacterium]|nr:hypothetical protein [Thermodesulfobacteriota bacterium]